MIISKSKFTPGAEARDVHLEIGEVVLYKLLNGETEAFTIDSPPMDHEMCIAPWGYEAISREDGGRYFIDSERIISWEGKCDTEEELNRLMNTQ